MAADGRNVVNNGGKQGPSVDWAAECLGEINRLV